MPINQEEFRMMIELRAYAPNGEPGHYHLALEETEEGMELAMELLNLFVREGYDLQSASLSDLETTFQLPVDAFDGQPISVHLRALRQEWEQSLNPL